MKTTSTALLIMSCKTKLNKVLSVDVPPCTLVIQASSNEGSFTDLPYITNFVFYNWYRILFQKLRSSNKPGPTKG